MKAIYGTVIGFLLFSNVVRADDFTREKEIFRAYETGDDFALISGIIRFIDKNPSSSEASIYLHDLINLADVVGYSAVRDKMKDYADREPHNAVGEMVRRKAYDYLSYIEYRMGSEVNNRFVEKYHPVSRWYVSSLFNKYGRGDILFGFGEESRPRPDKGMKRAFIETDGYMVPGKWISGETGIVYSHAVIDIPENSNIRIESDGEYVLFFNGIKAAENYRGRSFSSVRLFKCNGRGTSVITVKSFVKGTTFRVSVEDAGGKPLKPVELSRDAYYGNFTLTEIDDHVLSDLKARRESIEKEFYLGTYYSGCGSYKSFDHYEKACRGGRELISILLAWEYVRNGSVDERESLVEEGFSRIEQLSKTSPDIAPVQTILLQKKLMTVEPERILAFINNVKNTKRTDYGFALRECSFLMEYVPDVAEHTINQYLKKYPDSVSLKMLMAEQLLKSNNSEGKRRLEQIASGYRSDRLAELFAENMRMNGEYSGEIDRSEPLENESLISIRAEAMIACGQDDKAKKVLIKALSRRSNPDWLALLGRIEVRNGKDPDLYWGKSLYLYPEREFPGKYKRFLNGGSYSQMRSLINVSEVEDIIKRYRNGEVFDSAVVCRNYVTRIEYNRTARFYCEELIYLRNDGDIRKYAEYRIPFSRGVSIVKNVTYNRDGASVSSSRINEINSCMYLSIEGAVKDSLIHISYEADSYDILLAGSAMIGTGTIYLNDYDEAVQNAHAVLYVEKSVNIDVFHSNNLNPVKLQENDYNIIRLDAGNIPAIMEEDNSQDARSHLMWYSLSSVKNQYDLVSWYRGVINGKIPKINQEMKAGNDKWSILHSIHRNISNLMHAAGNEIWSVRSAEDIRRSGYATDHEKIIAAVAAMRENGIIAYPCIVADRFYPAPEGEITIERYNYSLIYVPGDANSPGIWVDLSDRGIPLGCVRYGLENSDAIVITDDNAFMRKVYSRIPSSENIEMTVSIGIVSADYEMKSVFNGDAARISGLFKSDDFERYGMAYAGQFSSDEDLSSVKFSVTDNGDFELLLSGEMRDVAVESSKSLFVTPFRKSGKIQEYARSRVRQTPLLIREGNVINEKYEYSLPKDVEAAELNYSNSFSREGITVSYSVVKKKGELKMTARRKTVISPVMIDTSQYGDFLEFAKKCSATDNMKFKLLKD